MVQTIQEDLKITIVINCYDDGCLENKHYVGFIQDYNGMACKCVVQASTVGECVKEIGISLEALEVYRKYQKGKVFYQKSL